MRPPSLYPFHLALPVDDLERAEAFYVGVLGARVGRRGTRWIDFDFFGHQVTVHLADSSRSDAMRNEVDGDRVPVPHFGVVLPPPLWREVRDRLQAAGVPFEIGPRVRFAGEVGEQSTLFVRDPAGHALEFKAFADPSRLFAS